MMAMPFCHMHGPEHHVMVGAALLTAYSNAGGDIVLADALAELMKRGKQVPGGACGFWGACGAGLSSGMFVSIITHSTPLTIRPFALSHTMTAASLTRIAEVAEPVAASVARTSPSKQLSILSRRIWVFVWINLLSYAHTTTATTSASGSAAPSILHIRPNRGLPLATAYDACCIQGAPSYSDVTLAIRNC